MNYRIGRIPYLIGFIISQWAIFEVVLGSEETMPGQIGVIGIVIAQVIFLAIPRARDAGWPWWIGVLPCVPYIGSVPGMALFLKGRDGLRISTEGEPIADSFCPTENDPARVSGNRCAVCGERLILEVDGQLIDGQVICNGCETSERSEQNAEDQLPARAESKSS